MRFRNSPLTLRNDVNEWMSHLQTLLTRLSEKRKMTKCSLTIKKDRGQVIARETDGQGAQPLSCPGVGGQMSSIALLPPQHVTSFTS